MGESTATPPMIRALYEVPTAIRSRFWTPTHGSPSVRLHRHSHAAVLYDVLFADAKVLGTPHDQPQWGSERVIFTGTRAEILAWVNSNAAYPKAA